MWTMFCILNQHCTQLFIQSYNLIGIIELLFLSRGFFVLEKRMWKSFLVKLDAYSAILYVEGSLMYYFKENWIFLAHLSTKCSGWVIVTGLCPSCVVCCASCVVRKLFYLNIFSSETTYWILTKLHRNDPWVIPYQSCSNGSDWLHY